MSHEHEHEHEDEIIVLTDEEGNEHKFAIVQVLTVDGKDYAILLPIEDDGMEGDEAVIMRFDEEDGEEILVEIEDEEEFDRVADAWEEMLDDEEFEEQSGK
nr:MAG: DUF1292 domain-containing protein [Bacillota bacterium]